MQIRICRDKEMQVRLTDLCNIQYGYAFDSGCFTDDENYMPLVRIRDVKRGFSETYYSGEYPEEYILHAGDLLIGMDGEFNIARWKSRDALLNQRVCKVSAKDGVCEEYLRFALSKELKGIEDRTAFVTVKHLSAKELNKLEMHVPEISEQQQIAETLDKIESIIEKCQRELNKLDELIKARFVELVRDNITTATKLKFVVEDERIITYGIVKPGEHTVGGVPIIKVKDFPNGVILLDDLLLASREIESKYKRSRVKEGDLLFSIRGSVGRTAFVPKELVDANITQDTARISIGKDYNPHYVRTALEYDTVQQSISEHVRGVAVKGISLAELREIEIPVVEKVLQDAFGRFIEQTDKSKVVFYI